MTRALLWLLERPLVVGFAALLLIAAGLVGLRALPVDAVPDVTNVQVQVLTAAPGRSPLEVEQQVTVPVELALSGIPGVATTRSVSRSGVSGITLVFDDAVPLDHARSLVAQRLGDAAEAVPEGVGRPSLGPLTTGLGEVVHFTLRWPGHALSQLRELAERDIGRRLRTVPGVVEVNLWGGDTRQAVLEPDDAALLAHGLTLLDVASAVRATGVSRSAGALESPEEATFVRVEASFRTLSDLEEQVVAPALAGVRAAPVLVRDVARVRFGAAPRLAAATADGEGETVYVMVQMVAHGNAHAVAADVRARLDEIRAALPAGVTIEPLYDRAQFVDRVLSTVKKNLLEGGVVVALVLLLMLGDWRAGLLVASVIPLAMLGAFLGMLLTGVSGNLLSLGAIDFGLVVDGAVVMVEGALAAMAAHRLGARSAMGKVLGEVGRPVLMAVLIITLVYLPVLTLEGVEGRMFRPMALTVLYAMGTALVLTFTWIPAMGALVLRSPKHHEPRLVGWLRRRYEPVLTRLLPRPGLVWAGVAALVLAGAVAAGTRDAEFVPRLEEGDLAIQVTRPPSVSLEEAVAGTLALERALQRFPEIERVVSRIGSPDVATDLMGVEMSDVIVVLRPRAEWTTAQDAAGLAEAMEPALRAALPGASFGFTQPIEMRVQELIGGVRSDLGVQLYGDDLGQLRELSSRLAQVLASVPGASDVRVEQASGLRSLQVRLAPERLGRLGLTPEPLIQYLVTRRSGEPLGTLLEGERRLDVVLRAHPVPQADVDTLARLRVPLEGGRSVELGEVAELTLEDGPAQMSREQGRRRITIEANVRGRALAGFVHEVRTKLGAVPLPPGYYLSYGGEYENLTRAAARLALVVPATLLAVLVLLYFTFGALRPAALVFVSIPTAASGGCIALWARGLEFSVSAAIGFLALFGVATLNGVVLLSACRSHEAEGLAPVEATRRAASERLRPVLTTALVAALGFLPMALATGSGAEVQRPLATVVIGGLVTATLATLLALPTLYARYGRARPAS